MVDSNDVCLDKVTVAEEYLPWGIGRDLELDWNSLMSKDPLGSDDATGLDASAVEIFVTLLVIFVVSWKAILSDRALRDPVVFGATVEEHFALPLSLVLKIQKNWPDVLG